jgi:ribosomal protein L3 glutamine methyltransferase
VRTLRELLDHAVTRFEAADLSYGHGTTNALDEAAWILLHALGLPHDALTANLDKAQPKAKAETALALVQARIATRKPAAYLLHEAWLGPHRFYVDERVIVPRSFIAELLRAWSWPRPARVLDLCTGSGCLAILAALQFPEAKVDAVDLSEDALAVARRNVRDYGLEARVELVRSDLMTGLAGRRYDAILSNPPYVKAASMRKLPDEYRQEPEMALASGGDGLDHTRAILAHAAEHLAPGGLLMVEIGHNRKALERAYPALPFRWPETSGGPGYVFTLAREDLAATSGSRRRTSSRSR